MKYDTKDIRDILDKVERIVTKITEIISQLQALGQLREALLLILSKLNTLQSDINKIKTKLGIPN